LRKLKDICFWHYWHWHLVKKMQNSSGMEIWSGLTHGNATFQKKIFVSSVIGIDIWSIENAK
jgi:hypothetical protein